MRILVVFVLLLVAGCNAPAAPPTGSEATSPIPTSPTFETNIADCKADPSGTQHATPVSNVPTRTVPNERIRILVAHRDAVATYDTDGTEEVAATPTRTTSLPFADDLGYRFSSDGTLVHDDAMLHLLGADHRKVATLNLTRLSGAVHHGSYVYAVADARLHILGGLLSPIRSLDIPNWTAPQEPRYDALYAQQDLLVVGTAGRPDHLLVYQILDRENPVLVKEIPIPRSDVPVGDANLGSASPGQRATPWIDVYYGHIVGAPERIYTWRDGAYQGNPGQTVSRFQDFVSIWRSNLSVEHLEQQYLEDNHYGWTQGAHVGPIDATAEWSLLHIKGTFSLAAMVHTAARVLPACHVDVQMSSFEPQDAFFHRNATRILLGTQTRVDAWDVQGEPGKIAEAKLPKPATDGRWL